MPSWGSCSPQVVSSFQDVMSEQLAHKLCEDDEKLVEERRLESKLDHDLAVKIALEESLSETQNLPSLGTVDSAECPLTTDQDTNSDLLLAQLLQNQWNKEHNDKLDRQEREVTGFSKVKVSLEKYKRTNDDIYDISDDSDDDEAYDSCDDDPLDNIVSTGNYSVKASPRYKGGKDDATKHDLDICSRRNTAKLANELPPSIFHGDDHSLSDIRLPNGAYNKLRQHCKNESKRSHRLHEKKEHSTADHAVDARTRLHLYKMVNNGILESVNGIMAVGKESVVIHANGGQKDDIVLPSECAIKIYKTTLTGFKNREVYVRGDHRFSRDEYSKQNPRKIMKLWAAKEKANLIRMAKCGVPCPQVALLNKHILVMSLIGSHGHAAPQLKNVSFTSVDAQIAYDQTIQIMKTLYHDCKLVHADFSQYNLLWHDNQVYVIDVSQSVELTHPQAMEFLYRDCRNITEFFSSIGVYEVPTTEVLFNEVTGLDIAGDGKVFLSNARQFDNHNHRFVDLPKTEDNPFQFDHFFENTTESGTDSIVMTTTDNITMTTTDNIAMATNIGLVET